MAARRGDHLHTRWLDERLAVAGLVRAGAPEVVSDRPWATVVRVPVAGASVWLKLCAPETAFEAGLYELLARVAPERVLMPLGVDAARGWILLPDGGPSLGSRLAGPELVSALTAALVGYGVLQRRLEPHVDEMLDLGVVDMGPRTLPARFEEALEVTGADVADLRPQIAEWCEELAASGLRASLDHNDLHPWNVLGHAASEVRFYDWGDAVVAHPFAAMLVPLVVVQRTLACSLDDERLLRVRDAYLEVFTDIGPRASLAATLEVACRTAKIARALVWHRAVRSASERGAHVDPRWTGAARATLEALRSEWFVGSA